MISYTEAVAIVQAQGRMRKLTPETVTLAEIVGRRCAENICAPVANQPFDNSAMDGFAVKTDDLLEASRDTPVHLQTIGHIAAGNPQSFASLQPGQCYEIMTGAPLPPGCDAVVPVERVVKERDGQIKFESPVSSVGENIRRKGEDIQVGGTILETGMLFRPAHILAAATVGIGQVSVYRKPKAALISTGPEVVEDLGAALNPGQIYNSTKPYMLAALAEAGIGCHFCGTANDDPQSFKDKLLVMLEASVDIGISTGAVSAGEHDFVPDVLREMGAEILFHKVAIRPGKPVLFAKFPGNGPLFFGLPGNPAATASGMKFFIAPLLQAMQGLEPEAPQYAVLKTSYKKGKLPLRFFMQGVATYTDEGLREVEIPARQPSFMVSPFVKSNVWAIIPEDISEMKAGDLVQICQ